MENSTCKERKDCRKDTQSAISSPKVNLCRPVGRSLFFCNAKNRFPTLRRVGNGGCSRWSQSVNLGRFTNEKIGERKRNGRKNTQAWPSEKSNHPKRFARGTDNPNRTFGDCRESEKCGHADKRLVPAVRKGCRDKAEAVRKRNRAPAHIVGHGEQPQPVDQACTQGRACVNHDGSARINWRSGAVNGKDW